MAAGAEGGQGRTEALELIQRAVQVRGDTAELLDTRGVIYLALSKNDLAVQDLEEANAQVPSAPRWFHLARGYQAAGEAQPPPSLP